MEKMSLNQVQLSTIVNENKYPVNQQTKFFSRCIDGRYENQVKSQKSKVKNNESQLPALAFPGADAGELALILATANAYGLVVSRDLVYDTLVEVVGGEKNINFHTDNHAEKGLVLAGCGHVKQMGLSLKDYQLDQEDLDFIKKKFTEAKQNGAEEVVLHGDHREGAVVYIEGLYGIYPQYFLKMPSFAEASEGRENEVVVQIFEYHKTLVNQRHRLLAEKLIKKAAMKLPEGTNEEYLYQALSDMAETHTLETAKRLAKGLPIYQVSFDEKGQFGINSLGSI